MATTPSNAAAEPKAAKSPKSAKSPQVQQVSSKPKSPRAAPPVAAVAADLEVDLSPLEAPLAFIGSVELRVVSGRVRILGAEFTADSSWHTVHSPAGGFTACLQTPSAISGTARVAMRRAAPLATAPAQTKKPVAAAASGKKRRAARKAGEGGDDDDDDDEIDDAVIKVAARAFLLLLFSLVFSLSLSLGVFFSPKL